MEGNDRMAERIEELREDIEANRVPGGSAFARAGAGLIALSLKEAAATSRAQTIDLVEELADWLSDVKPSMAVVRNVADLARRVASQAPETPGDAAANAVVSAMDAFCERSERAIAQLASFAMKVIPAGAKVLVHSYSASLVALLHSAVEAGLGYELLVTESRPYRESRRLVDTLVDTEVPITLFSDAGVAIAASKADLAVVGADSVFADGSFANKTGSLPLAQACAREDVPVYVATELAKVYPGDPADVAMELRPAAELAEGWPLAVSGRVTVWNQFFERVEAGLVTRYVTEAGLLAPGEMLAAARAAQGG